MKNLLTLLLVITATSTFSQSNADENFALVINGKWIESGDTLQKSTFNNIEKTKLEVLNTSTGAKYVLSSYQWVVSVKKPSSIWKGSVTPESKNNTEHPIAKAVLNAAYGDIVFIDQLKSTSPDVVLPKQFVFYVR